MRHSLRLGIAASSMLVMSVTAFAQDTTFSQKPFTDVPKSSAGYEGIEYLRTHNVIKGYADGTYKPDTRINRAEFVMLVTNPFILDTNDMNECLKTNVPENVQTVFFPDVDKSVWYASPVCFAKMSRIVDGYPDGTFRPGESINFVEAAKIISNVFSIQVKNEENTEFWYRPYVQSLSDLHAIPTSIKRFDQILTRGEMAEILYRLKADKMDKASATMGSIK
jgi:hypothetical protein